MEIRTNELFKSYLQETTVSKTPSPVPQVHSYRDNLQKAEKDVLNKSISTLCKMMENCQIQLQSSNEIMSNFLSKDSDYVMIQKNQLKEFFDEFKQELTEFKNDIKNDLGHLKNISHDTEQNNKLPSSQKSVFNIQAQPENKSSQKSIFSLKPLTPPSSFEALFEKDEIYENDLKPKLPQAFSIKEENNNQSQFYPPSQCTEVSNKRFTKTPSISYKMEKRKKAQNCKQEKPNIPSKPRTNASKFSHTQKWLESLPLPPPDKAKKPSFSYVLRPTSKIRKKADKGGGQGEFSDNESIGKWSCKSIRTYKSTRKRGANYVKIDRNAQSEVGWGVTNKSCYDRKFVSEY